MNRLDGKVAIVTGAAAGMGLTIAQTFAEEGAKVVTVDVQAERLKEEAEKINNKGGEVLALKLDISSPNEWSTVIDETIKKFGKVDVLVNNAAITSGKDVKAINLDEWNRVLTVNTTGTLLGMQAVISEMQKNGQGSIINISSIGGIVGGASDGFDVAYSASKGAVRSMSKHAAQVLAKDKIRVNTVHPGAMRTEMMEDSLKKNPEIEKTIEANYPLPPHLGEPKDLAYLIVYLASDESSFATGSEFTIDGGYTSR